MPKITCSATIEVKVVDSGDVTVVPLNLQVTESANVTSIDGLPGALAAQLTKSLQHVGDKLNAAPDLKKQLASSIDLIAKLKAQITALEAPKEVKAEELTVEIYKVPRGDAEEDYSKAAEKVREKLKSKHK